MTPDDRLNRDDLHASRIKSFQKLMRYKIRDILLVSSLYDEYLFEEDGRLYDLIRQEFQVLNLSHPPEITHAPTATEALDLLSNEQEQFDLIIATPHIEDMHVVRFAQTIRKAGISIPIVLLAYDNKERKEIETGYDTSIFERIFIWQGDYRLLIAIIKLIEDRINVAHDTALVGVQVIILVEDNVKFYSSYLPLIYTEILNQSQRLISEGINVTHRFMRMRARPKILLATSYEQAWSHFEQYREYVLGIISDVNFKHGQDRDPIAGITFIKNVKQIMEDIPVLIQSSNPVHADRAHAAGADFLLKGSPRLLHDLHEFIMKNFGFGDFTFRDAAGREVGCASNLSELEEQLRTVPGESIVYHARRNHFSNWLKARTEFWLAYQLRPHKVDDFATVEDLRQELISSLRKYREIRQRGVITDFDKETFNPKNSFTRLGSGSLGGKARGLGFINQLINNYDVHNKFAGVEVSVPSAVVIATDVFDIFLQENGLEQFALTETNDEEILQRFVGAKKFPKDIIHKLSDLLDIVHEPLAVRSSSLLEDSQYQPFAGVYQTFMIPNNDIEKTIRLEQLIQSIKLVYASTFLQKAKDYMKATAYRLEEEKMAVIIQRMVGAERDGRFYPDFAGVAKSYNFYPVPPQKSTDGIVLVALGLGWTVVEGGTTVRFCPNYPRHLLQFFSTKETLRNAQQDFYALNIREHVDPNSHYDPDRFIQQYDLLTAEKDGTLFYVGSTYSPENDAVYDGISRSGVRVVTFAPILKHKAFPLAEILDFMLQMGSWGMGAQVEIEFAVNMKVPQDHPKEFAMLQIRPLVLHRELDELDISYSNTQDLLCQSHQVLGNGIIQDIFDAVVVDIHTFDRSRSREVAQEVATLNAKLLNAKRPYILIGVGRWGSLDHWLGISVTWDQISGASVIVESGFKDFDVTPSQGSHFFQNITSFRVGYFTVDSANKLGFIDWEWMRNTPAEEEYQFTRHLRFSKPLTVKINGHKNHGIIIKPGK
jgi:CheY-like chemotaxis protein